MTYRIKPWLERIESVIRQGPYSDSWASLNRYQVPAWYRDAKFGIFIHWGVYSVPAYRNEWYARNMYLAGTPEFEHHVATYGPHKDFGYKDFIPMFRAEHFDPAEWAKLFKEAGAKYVVPVCEHHDGFQMYKSRLSHWNAAEMGPKRDLMKDLAAAIRREKLVNGGSTHRIEHYWFLEGGRQFESDFPETLSRGDLYWPSMPGPKNHGDNDSPDSRPTQEFLEDWMIRTCELIDHVRPRVLYFDWWIQEKLAKPYLKKIAAYYYNRMAEWGLEGVICYKHDAFMFGSALPDVERGVFSEAKPYYWQTDTAVARNSWCYTTENSYKTVPELLCYLIDVVSKNGNLLLNIGPKADGTIPKEDAALLRGMGAWLKVNGKAIYGSKPWRISAEGPTKTQEGGFTDAAALPYTSEDFRFTVNGNTLYAIALAPSGDGTYLIRSLGNPADTTKTAFMGIISDVRVPGYQGPLSWEAREEGLYIRMTPDNSGNPVVFAVKTV